MIIRSYSCLNRRCRFEFDSEGDFPPCPRCRGLRVQWVPRPVNINSSRTINIDKIARGLADDFGVTNFNTPQAGRAAVTPPPASGNSNTFEPQKGWRIAMPDAALQGSGHAICAPTGVTAKIKVDPNAGALTENPNFGLNRMRAATRFEATHRGKVPQ